MALSVRIQPLERNIELLLPKDFSPAARSARLARAARFILSQTDAQNARVLGEVPNNRTFVDGIEGASLESVKPNGRIIREYDLVPDAISAIRFELSRTSPRLTGRYLASHTLFADGVEVSDGEQIPPAQEYQFISLVPYARKLEKLYRVYQQAAESASRRYGNSVRVRFGFRSVRGGMVGQWAEKTRRVYRRQTHGERRREWLTRQPAIIVTVK